MECVLKGATHPCGAAMSGPCLSTVCCVLVLCRLTRMQVESFLNILVIPSAVKYCWYHVLYFPRTRIKGAQPYRPSFACKDSCHDILTPNHFFFTLNIWHYRVGLDKAFILICLIGNKSHDKTKNNNGLIGVTSVLCVSEAWYLISLCHRAKLLSNCFLINELHCYTGWLVPSLPWRTHCSLYWVNPTCTSCCPKYSLKH